jgi:hypothetical protein
MLFKEITARLFWEFYETYRYIQWQDVELLSGKASDTHNYH